MKIWQYRFPPKAGEGWALLILREDGFFSAVSDYGNYAYLWSAHGQDDFRKFFLKMDWHYVAKKLKPRETIDPDDSFAAVKRFICEMRHEHRYTKEQARERWDHVERFRGDSVWEAFLYDSDTHEYFVEPWNFGQTRMDADVVAFAKIIVCERLREAIRAELEKEGVNVPVHAYA